MKHDYKVGDRVRVLNTDWFAKGSILSIVKIDSNAVNGELDILCDDGYVNLWVNSKDTVPYIETQKDRIQQFANAVFDMLDEKIKESLAERDYEAVASLAQLGESMVNEK